MKKVILHYDTTSETYFWDIESDYYGIDAYVQILQDGRAICHSGINALGKTDSAVAPLSWEFL